MEGEILLKRKVEDADSEGDSNPLKNLEEKVSDLLKAFQEIKKERDALVSTLDMEKEKSTGWKKSWSSFPRRGKRLN